MEHPENSNFASSLSAAASLSTAEYVRLLHPLDVIGKPSVLWKDANGTVHTKTYDLAAAPMWVELGLEGDVYISLHRFFGQRRVDKVASLNALFLDLDIDRIPPGAPRDPNAWSRSAAKHAERLGLPTPTVALSTGRGLAMIWLIDPLPPKALPRWQATQNAVIELFRVHGADPKCRDAARVTRVPGSTNSKNGQAVKVLSGSLARYGFDELADAVFVASGRPTREQLDRRRRRKGNRKDSAKQRGLPPRARFEAIRRDLERLREYVGGTIPEGQRNTWLHLYATCLSHTVETGDIQNMVRDKAAEATPNLPAGEVRAIARQAERHAALPYSGIPLTDGRLHYSGETIAELLDVAAEKAALLGLEQIMPPEERARRKAERQKKRRRETGSIGRDDWLHKHAQEAQRPWETLGVSRATYFRWKKAGKIDP